MLTTPALLKVAPKAPGMPETATQGLPDLAHFSGQVLRGSLADCLGKIKLVCVHSHKQELTTPALLKAAPKAPGMPETATLGLPALACFIGHSLWASLARCLGLLEHLCMHNHKQELTTPALLKAAPKAPGMPETATLGLPALACFFMPPGRAAPEGCCACATGAASSGRDSACVEGPTSSAVTCTAAVVRPVNYRDCDLERLQQI